MVSPVVMYGCESWTIKKAEHQRMDAFELWCWGRLLRVPWTEWRSNQSILKEINPEYSLEGWCWSWNSNTLATWCEEMTHLKRLWCWERFKAGGEGNDRGWHGWMASLTQWTWVWVGSRKWWRTENPDMLQSMGLQGVGHEWATELNWTEEPSSLQQSRVVIVASRHFLACLPCARLHLRVCIYFSHCPNNSNVSCFIGSILWVYQLSSIHFSHSVVFNSL